MPSAGSVSILESLAVKGLSCNQLDVSMSEETMIMMMMLTTAATITIIDILMMVIMMMVVMMKKTITTKQHQYYHCDRPATLLSNKRLLPVVTTGEGETAAVALTAHQTPRSCQHNHHSSPCV